MKSERHRIDIFKHAVSNAVDLANEIWLGVRAKAAERSITLERQFIEGNKRR